MLNKKELEILMKLFDNLKLNPTIRQLSLSLNQKYPQTFKLVKYLEKQGLLILETIGKSKIIKLDFSTVHLEYLQAEVERTQNIQSKNKPLSLISSKLAENERQFVCILFGSQASGKAKSSSDIDLLFIISEEYSKEKFEREIKNSLSLYNIDINVITERDFKNMLNEKNKLNVAKEILTNHCILKGYDFFLNILRRSYE